MGLRGLLTIASILHTASWISEYCQREETYRAAQETADLLSKPLLVVGSPLGSNPLRRFLGCETHGWGDACLDLDPRSLEGAPEGVLTVAADVRDIPFDDRTFGAVIASHVLEHLDTREDAELALAELDRVADVVYVAGPNKWNIRSWLVPDHSLWVWQEPDGEVIIEERPDWQRWVNANGRIRLGPG